MKYLKFLYLLPLIFIMGCSNSLKPVSFKSGKISKPIVTNNVELVTLPLTNTAKVSLPVIISNHPEITSNDVIIPKEILVTITIPGYTNKMELSRIDDDKSLHNSLIVYGFIIVGGGLVLGYIYLNKRNKKKLDK